MAVTLLARILMMHKRRGFTPVKLTLALAGVLVALSVIFFLRAEKDRLIESRLAYLSAVNRLAAEDVARLHRECLTDLNAYAANLHLSPDYHGTLRRDAAHAKRFARSFAPLLSHDLYTSVTLFDPRGRAVLTIPQDAEAPAFSTATAGPPRYIEARQTPGGDRVMDYEAWSKDGSRLVLSVQADSPLSPFVSRWPGDEITGTSLVYQLEPGAIRLISEFPKDDPLRRSGTVSLDSNVIGVRAARGEREPSLGLDHRGTRCFTVTRLLPEFGNLVVTKMSEVEALAPMRAKAWLLWLGAAGLYALLGSITFVVARIHRDRIQADSDADNRLLATAIEQAGESVVITDRNAVILYTNPAFSRATGYSKEEALGKNPNLLNSGQQNAAFYKNLWDTLERGEVWAGRFSNRRKDGKPFEEEATITPVRDESGAVGHYIAVKRDVSAVKALEDQLRHAQKMEAIGLLAGGVAHDFNNILTTINGYAEMLAAAAPADSQLAADLAEILGAGRRAALLTRQLLTFSRRAPVDPVVVDLRVPMRSIEKMLRRTLGEDVQLTLNMPQDALWILTDPGQLDQIFMNLAVNARDAMPRGGSLRISARVEVLVADLVQAADVLPKGRYALLEIADDGEGMGPDVMSRIYEPFFTTKEKGKGTGLGLAMVFGIVKQNKGCITVDSAPTRGTTFTVYLPLVAAPVAAPSEDPTHLGNNRGDETILVVEDQSDVLGLVTRALTAQGYRVIAAKSAAEALNEARGQQRIHLLLTDVVMPGMGGEVLAANMRQSRPEMKVLFMSGYTDGRLDSLSETSEWSALLLKPFTPEQVCRRVRSVLDEGAPRPT